MVPLALGTDTGGSVRIPAALCGITGLRPTYGRVSLNGIIVNTWTVDTAGPMSSGIEDNAIMLQAIAGVDPKDPACAAEPVANYPSQLRSGVRGLRIGVPKEHFFEVAPDVEAGVRAAISRLQQLGATLVEIEIPHARHAEPVRNILFAESACYHEVRLRERADLIGQAARERLEAVKFITATDYIKAQRLRSVIVQEVESAFKKCDVFIVPTQPNTASLLSEGLAASSRSPRPLNNGGTFIASVTGIPSLAVPCGFSTTQPPLPFSMLIHAKPFQEGLAYRFGYAYQSVTDWHKRIPPLV
jgi:aspartyl-tRNA(Asn)/glutamyl-tRNA(Gln) amidotransferase subunit A